MLVNTGGRMSEVVNAPNFCCVSLTDGECRIFDSGKKVHPVNAILNLEEFNNDNVN